GCRFRPLERSHPPLEGKQAEAAREAWLAAEARLLSPQGRPLPEVIALEVLQGNRACLPLLADWLAEHGLLEPAVRQRLEHLRTGNLETEWRLAAGLACDFNNLLTIIL